MANHKDTIRGLYEAFARGDVPGVLAGLSPDISWTEAEGFPYAGTHVGHDAVLQNVFMRLGTEWEGYVAVPGEFIAEGDTVVVVGTYRGKYLATGKSFETPFVHVWKMDGDLAATFTQHTDTAVVQKALEPA